MILWYKQELHVKKSFYKSLLNSACFQSNRHSLLFCYQTIDLLKVWVLFLVSKKGQKRSKSCNLNYRNYSKNYFHIKMSLKFLVKSLVCSVFFTDHLRHKILNKTSCRATSCRTMCTLVEELSNCWFFFGFQDFLVYLAEYFWSHLNFPYMIFQLLFCKSNANKTDWLVSLQCRNTITVFKLRHFSHESYIK